MTRGEMITRVARKLSLSTRASHQDLLFLQETLDQAVIKVLLRTKCYVDIGNQVLTAGETKYRTNAAILQVLNAEMIGGRRDLEVVQIDELQDRARSVTYQDLPYMIAGQGNLLMVFPPPASDSTIQYTFVPFPSPMTDDGHDLSNPTYGGIPEEIQSAVEYYLLWQAAEYDEKSSAQNAEYFQTQYEREVIMARKAARGKFGRRMPRAKVGYPGSPYRHSRNDVYPA
jgi:hypothetical protein